MVMMDKEREEEADDFHAVMRVELDLAQRLPGAAAMHCGGGQIDQRPRQAS